MKRSKFSEEQIVYAIRQAAPAPLSATSAGSLCFKNKRGTSCFDFSDAAVPLEVG